ncbi:Pachytene arrest protein sae3, partial [Kluyveromyces marxianus]
AFYSTKTPEKVNQQHIEDLKLYNELRDTGLRLVQMVADEKQCKIKDVFEEIGYDMED